MKIDDCESLKKWLVQVLTPMFDGDPEKLALYIVALAKKVDNDLSSRQRCIEDLEVFLEAQTNGFVNQLFDALVNKTYTTTAAATPVATAPAAPVTPVEQQPRVQQTTPTSRSNQRPSRTDHYHSHDSKSSSSYYNRRSDGRGRSRSNERRRGGGGGRNRSRGGRNRGGSSSSSSSSPSPVRRRSRSRSGASRSKSRSRSPFYRSDKSRNSDSYASKDTRTVVPSSSNGNETSTAASGGKRQRCRDYDEKGFCTAGEFCPYEHSNAVVAPIPGSSSTTLPQSQYQNRPYQKRSKSSYQPKYRNNQPQQQPTNSSDMFNQPPPQQQRPIIGMNPLMGNRPRNLVELTAASSQAFDDPSARSVPVKRSYTAEYNLQIAPPGYNNNNTALLPTPQPTNLIPPPSNIITSQPPPTSFIPPPKNLNYTPNFPTTNAPLPSGDQFNSSLVVRRIPVEMNRVENLSQHFAQFGPIVDIQCAFESNSDAALVVFGNNQAAQAAFKCPQPVFNNRFIRLYWLPHHLKMTRPQHQQQPRQQHPNQQQQQHSAQFTSPSNLNQSSITDQEMTQRPGEDQPPQMGTKRPARDRLSYGNKPYEMAVTKPNEFPNKENQQQQKFPPEEITKTIYNPNATKTVDNQPSESSMDLTTETQQQQQQIDFSQLSLKTAALEANKPQPKSSIAMARQIESENQKKVLMLKLEVQRKARELMEKQIKDQKVLLEKFEKAKTPEEKSQIYALIKKISEAIEKEKEILNESPSGGGGGGKAKMDSTHSRVVPAAPHLLKLNNKRLNTTSFLKGVSGGALSPKTVAAAAAQQPSSPSASSAAVSAFFNYSKVSVDNRPKKILFSGINTQNEKTNIVNFISTLGVKIDSVDQIAGSSDSASTEASTEQTVVPFSVVLTFATRKDAEFALTKCSASLTSKRIKIAWYRPEQEQQQQPQNQQQQQEPEKQSNPDTADIEAEMKPNESFDNAANNSLESSINKPSGEETSNEQQPQQGDHQIEMVNNDENNDVFEDLFTN